MRVQGHYGRREVVKKHITPSVKAPFNASFSLRKNSIMAERALSREHAVVRSGTSVENRSFFSQSENCIIEKRPFLCQPPMGQTSFYGGFDGGVGHQIVPQLHSCGAAADCTSPNTMLWGMENQWCINRAHGQDTETGLFTPVLQHPSSVQRQERSTSVIPGGGFLSACALKSERRGIIPCTSWFLRRQENSGPFWIFNA